jgi:hypothetical protein
VTHEDDDAEEELDYYKRKRLDIPPQQRYQDKRNTGFFVTLSGISLGLNAYAGYGCSEVYVYPV